LAVSQESHREAVTELVVSYLRYPGRIAIIEDYTASPSAEWLTRDPPNAPWLAYGDHLYWYATSPQQPALDDFLGAGVGLHMCIALTTAPAGWPPRALVEREVANLGRLADHFIMDAYDFEGWVIWSRVRETATGRETPRRS
jgi:hypothetical protein